MHGSARASLRRAATPLSAHVWCVCVCVGWSGALVLHGKPAVNAHIRCRKVLYPLAVIVLIFVEDARVDRVAKQRVTEDCSTE